MKGRLHLLFTDWEIKGSPGKSIGAEKCVCGSCIPSSSFTDRPTIITHVTEKGTSVSRASFVLVLEVMNLRGGLRDYVESS